MFWASLAYLERHLERQLERHLDRPQRPQFVETAFFDLPDFGEIDFGEIGEIKEIQSPRQVDIYT